MSQLPHQPLVADQDPTLHDVLGAISSLSTDMDGRFDRIEARFDRLEPRVDKIETRLDQVESQMVTKDYLKEELNKMKVTMVTKDYLDDKLYDLRGDLTVMVRKKDKRVTKVIDLLHKKKIFTEQEVQAI